MGNLDYQQRVFDMVCEQHESDRQVKTKESQKEDGITPAMVEMAA